MDASTETFQKCCKIRKKNIPDVEKKTRISALFNKFTKNQRGSNAFCSLCIAYIKYKPEISRNGQKSVKRVCSSSFEKNPRRLTKSHRRKHPWDTIIINQIPLEFDRKQLTSVFLKYGSIEDVYYCEKPKEDPSRRSGNKHERIARVRFTHEEDARKVWEASQQKLIRLGDNILMITLVSDTHSPIQSLPDDCLREVFSRLPVNDKLTVEKVCKRWKKIGSQSWSHITKIKDGWSSTSWKTIAARTAKSLHELILDLPEECRRDDEKNEDSPFVTLASIAKHYTQLNRLGISWNSEYLDEEDEEYPEFPEYIPHLRTIISKNQNLRIIYLQYVELDEGFFDWLPRDMNEIHLRAKGGGSGLLSLAPVDLSRFLNLEVLAIFAFDINEDQLKGIENLENLKILKFDQSEVHPSNIEKTVNFKKLEHLAIRNCQISNSALMKILKNNKDLSYLDISDIEGLRDSAFQYVCQLPKLEELWMQNLPEVSCLGAMPKLKTLRANGCSSITDEDIQRLFTPDSMLWLLIIAGCSVSWRSLVAAFKFAKAIRNNAVALHIGVDRETDQLWNTACQDETLTELRNDMDFSVSEYDAEKDYHDPVYDNWCDFDH